MLLFSLRYLLLKVLIEAMMCVMQDYYLMFGFGWPSQILAEAWGQYHLSIRNIFPFEMYDLKSNITDIPKCLKIPNSVYQKISLPKFI